MGTVGMLWARRLALVAVLAGVLVQAALGVPGAMRMAAAGPICSASHPAGGGEAPFHAAHDHDHCLLCHPGAGPPLPLIASTIPLPSAVGWAAPVTAVAALVLSPTTTGFSSRAPPALA